jgi:hypothetical protein
MILSRGENEGSIWEKPAEIARSVYLAKIWVFNELALPGTLRVGEALALYNI